MSIITRMLKDFAVYWEISGYDAFGNPSISSPIQLTCRWEDSQQQIVTSDGTPITAKSIVYVNQDVITGGYLFHGLLADAPSDPKISEKAFLIRRFDKLPNLRYTEYLRTAYI